MTRVNEIHRRVDLLQQISLSLKVTIGIIVVGILLAACGEATPTVAPPPGLTATNPVPTETRTPTRIPTATATGTPAARPFVLYENMSSEGGPEQCAQNTIDLSRPDVDQQMAAMIQSIRAQVGEPTKDIIFRTTPGFSPGSGGTLWPEFLFTLQGIGQNAPILGCGEAQLGEARGRIQFVDWPFPDGSFVTIGLISEPQAVETIRPGIDALTDRTVFRTLQQGTYYVDLNIFVNDASFAITRGRTPENQQLTDQFYHDQRAQLGVAILPEILDKLEAQHFSEYFIEEFWFNDLTHIEELRQLMAGKLIPGYITVDVTAPSVP